MKVLNKADKSTIRLINAAILDALDCDNIIKQISTGANIYTVLCRYDIRKGLIYSVHKQAKSGKDLGKVVLDEVSTYGVSYHSETIHIPDSVTKFITQFNKALINYRSFGEKILNW